MKSAVIKGHNYQFKTNFNMRTKTSFLAVTKAFFILLVMCCFSSCDTPQGTSEEKTDKGYTIKTIDSCEYIEYDYGIFDQRVYSLTHKGNCKYCAERAKRSLK